MGDVLQSLLGDDIKVFSKSSNTRWNFYRNWSEEIKNPTHKIQFENNGTVLVRIRREKYGEEVRE